MTRGRGDVVRGDIGLGDVGRGASDAGTWDSGTWDSGKWDSERWDSERWDAGTLGRAGTQGRERLTTPDFCAKFVKYNFRWSRERYCMLKSLSAVANDLQRPWFVRICFLAI